MAANEGSNIVVNQHYDESVEVNDFEEIASPSPRNPVLTKIEKPSSIMSYQDTASDEQSLEGTDKDKEMSDGNEKKTLASFSEGDSEESESVSGDEDDEDNDDMLEGAYDPAQYDDLDVSQEVKQLFQYITRYTPQTIELEYKLKPFIPEYIPAVGDIDAFIKVPRPDKKESMLGYAVLDEPCAKQSDPTVLDLQLRSISKMSGMKAMQVRSIDNAQKNTKAINSWIESMEELHRSKPPQSVHYTRPMPDIDFLMQEWPPEMESLLSKVQLPTADLDCDLQTYVDLICKILDIPVGEGGRVQSLHKLFTLYMEFKNSQHFQSNEHSDQPVANAPEVIKFD